MSNENTLFGPDPELHEKMYEKVAPKIIDGPWHWFGWLFAQGRERPFVAHLITACIQCELKLTGLGWLLIEDIASIAGKEKFEPHYEMLLQKLSEILILRQLLNLPWPEGTIFTHEPVNIPDGKRPELKVETQECIFLFEVKAPSLLSHQRNRSQNPVQFPGRMFDDSMRKILSGNQTPILPRDNPIKDFLTSAENKFAQFSDEEKITFGVLVIVWDDFVFEPITSLVHSPSQGLLTPDTFAKSSDGSPIVYPNIDVVFIIRHLLYFQQGAAETLTERSHAFDFGTEKDLPNIYIPNNEDKDVPEILTDGLRAFHHKSSEICNFSDYRPQELIMWINT